MLVVSPKTKVYQLLEAYPELEEVLIKHVPAFKKLKNPILRNTVAKITTLQQAATVGNVRLEDLINLLRKEVGQDTIELAGSVQYNTRQPHWFNPSAICSEIDIREMLSAGEQPVNLVISELKGLSTDGICKIVAPFIPAPLIDKSLSLDVEHWVKKESEELYMVYFKRTKA